MVRGVGQGIVKDPAVEQLLLEAQGQAATGAHKLGQAPQGGTVRREAFLQLVLLTDEAVKSRSPSRAIPPTAP